MHDIWSVVATGRFMQHIIYVHGYTCLFHWCCFCQHFLQRPADIIRRKRPFALWFPYTTIERLLYQLEELIRMGHMVDHCDKLKKMLHGSLLNHLKMVSSVCSLSLIRKKSCRYGCSYYSITAFQLKVDSEDAISATSWLSLKVVKIQVYSQCSSFHAVYKQVWILFIPPVVA